MSHPSRTRLALKDYLAALQAQLSNIRRQAAMDEVEFDVEAVTVDVDISYTLAPSSASERPTPEFWMELPVEPESNHTGDSAHRSSQRISVRLSPRRVSATAQALNEIAPLSSMPRARVPEDD